MNRKQLTDAAIAVFSICIVLFVVAVISLAGYILLAALLEVARDI